MSRRDKMRGQRYADLAEQRQARITEQAAVRRDREQRQQRTVAAEVAHARDTALQRANRRY